MSLLAKPPLATAAERVAQAVRRSILTGALPSGTAIRQEDLAAQYNVSRMPVREALRQLESEGLLTIYPNRGAFVTTLSPQDVQEIYDMRTLLEGDALRRAWLALIPTLLDQADLVLDRLDAATESTDWSALDEQFHATLYAPAQRPRLLDLITTLRHQVNHIYFLTHNPLTYHAARQHEHRRIIAACRNGDLAGAVAALEEHLAGSAALVLGSYTT